MRNLIDFLIRYSNFLIFLILEVVAFILIGTTHEYQQSSVWSSTNRIVASTNRIRSSINGYFHLREDNTLLSEENALLKSQLMELQNKIEPLAERDSQYIYAHLDWEYIPAKVIDITTHKQHNYLTLNKGSRDGIEKDMGVVCAEGLVGIVSAVAEKYSLVVPIIHTNISISTRLKSCGQIGGTQWDGRNHQYVHLTEIARHISINTNDTVVTSGLTSVFPEGILIGVIDDIELNPGDNYHSATIQLSTNYRALKYVQVLRNRNKEQDHSYHGMD